MLDFQSILLVVGLIGLLAVMFMVLVRPDAARRRYRRTGLGQTGRPGSAAPQGEQRNEPVEKESAPHRKSKRA